MKNLRNFSILMLALFTATITFAQDNRANNIDNSNIALQGYSPVSYLDLGIAQRGVKEYKSEHDKVIYYLYAGAKFRPDPNKFIVKDGKYLLFLYNLELDAQQLWLAEKNHNKLVSTADANWNKLKSTYN